MGDSEIDSRLIIRRMRENDLESVYQVEKQAHIQPWSLKVLSECFHSDYLCFVATNGIPVCGHIILSTILDESHLLNVCVSLEHQGNGVGYNLICEGIAQVSQVGAKKMFLEVRRSNIAAIGLYKSLGFLEVGVREDYYRNSRFKEDALVFALDIG